MGRQGCHPIIPLQSLLLSKHWKLCQQTGKCRPLLHSAAEGLYRTVYIAEIIIETSVPSVGSRNLSGNTKFPLIHPDPLHRELILSHNVKYLGRVQLVGFDSTHYVSPRCRNNVASGV